MAKGKEKRQGAPPSGKGQYDKFKQAAKEHECEDVDEAQLEKVMKRLASLPSKENEKKAEE